VAVPTPVPVAAPPVAGGTKTTNPVGHEHAGQVGGGVEGAVGVEIGCCTAVPPLPSKLPSNEPMS